ncbi:hypothetical protein CL634_09950 [bacterium]|nr:hypothetical protein [bacterium]
MKVGDLVQYQYTHHGDPPADGMVGTVIDFPPAVHAKQFKKVKVLTENGIEDWIMQFCEVISESR